MNRLHLLVLISIISVHCKGAAIFCRLAALIGPSPVPKVAQSSLSIGPFNRTLDMQKVAIKSSIE